MPSHELAEHPVQQAERRWRAVGQLLQRMLVIPLVAHAAGLAVGVVEPGNTRFVEATVHLVQVLVHQHAVSGVGRVAEMVDRDRGVSDATGQAGNERPGPVAPVRERRRLVVQPEHAVVVGRVEPLLDQLRLEGRVVAGDALVRMVLVRHDHFAGRHVRGDMGPVDRRLHDAAGVLVHMPREILDRILHQASGRALALRDHQQALHQAQRRGRHVHGDRPLAAVVAAIIVVDHQLHRPARRRAEGHVGAGLHGAPAHVGDQRILGQARSRMTGVGALAAVAGLVHAIGVARPASRCEMDVAVGGDAHPLPRVHVDARVEPLIGVACDRERLGHEAPLCPCVPVDAMRVCHGARRSRTPGPLIDAYVDRGLRRPRCAARYMAVHVQAFQCCVA
jgi:hypothetical protein